MAPVSPPVSGGDSSLDSRPNPPPFQPPCTGFEQKSCSQVPTSPNKLEADYTGTRPETARGGLGAPAGLRLPPPRRGAGRGPHFPAQPTGRGMEARGGVPAEVKGLTFRARGQKGQTPNTHVRQESADPRPGLPALPIARKEAERGALGGAGGRQGCSPLAGPNAGQARGARHSDGPKSSKLAARRSGAQLGPARRPAPGPQPNPLAARCRPQPQLGPRVWTPAPGWGRPLRLRRPPAPARERGAPTLGAARAAWPPSHGLR